MPVPKIALVCMPFGSIRCPSLGLGILKACLARAGLACTVDYASLEFARRVGLEHYNLVEHGSSGFMLGEWMFSGTVFADFAPPHGAYLAEISRAPASRAGHSQAVWESMVWEVRRQAAGFVEETARALVARGVRIVGCSSTFEQNLASLALLKRVRELDPTVITVMGGANCEGLMGMALVRNFAWLDLVVSGEADELAGPLFASLLAKGLGAELPEGVIGRPLPEVAPRASVRTMEGVPRPDFDAYFEALQRLGLAGRVQPALPIETSRGCWWGNKHHCTFCGLNGSGMSFRSKKPELAVAEFHELAARHGVKQFMVADNILDPSYFRNVLPALAEAPEQYEIFYEVKPNMKRPQLELLARAGVRWIQPGLESLSDELLSLMNKGTTGLNNVQLLKWCRELGIHVTWIMLYAFPGEQAAWYEAMLRWLPQLTHLQPPSGLLRMGIHRFSPYFERAADFGLEPVAESAYAVIYALEAEELRDLAYFFTDRRQQLTGQILLGPLQRWMGTFWRERPILCLMEVDEQVLVLDTRPGARPRRRSLEGLERRVVLETGGIRSRASLGLSLGDWSAEEVDEALLRLEGEGLLLCQGDHWLGLGLWGDPPQLEPRTPQGRLLL